jgi:short-subunit dehydrogenase
MMLDIFMTFISFAVPLINKQRLQKKYGKDSYVFITGGSDGIGKEYAKFFAKNGFNLILWSRTLSKLEAVRDELVKSYPKIDIKLIAANFSFSSEEKFFAKNLESIKDLDISIVINNVAYLTLKEKLDHYQIKSLVRSINVNLIPQAVLSSYFMKIFEARPSDVSSAFIDLSSISSYSPLSQQSIYGATKMFNVYFTKSVFNLYLNKSNILCQTVKPGPVETKMFSKALTSINKRTEKEIKMPGFMKTTADKTVIGSIRAMEQYIFETGGSFNHSLINFLLMFFVKVLEFRFDLMFFIKNRKK